MRSGPVTITIEPASGDEASPSFTFKYESQKLWMPFSMAIRIAHVILDVSAAFSSKTPPPTALPEPSTHTLSSPAGAQPKTET